MVEELWITLDKFSGIDQSCHEYDLPTHASPKAQNMESEQGILRTAKGYQKYYEDSLGGTIYALENYYQRGASGEETHYVIAATLNGLYARSDDDLSWQEITGNEGQDLYFSCMESINCSSGDQYIFLFTTDGQLMYYNGVSTIYPVDSNFLTHMDSICLNAERVWGVGNLENKERVWYSEALNPLGWTSENAGYIDIPSWKGNRNIAVRSYFNDVVVFKDNEIYRVYGTYPGEFSVAKVHGECGALTPKTIVEYQDKVYFLNEEGICYYDGVRTGRLTDNKLREFFKTYNLTRTGISCATVYQGKILFSIATGSAKRNNTIVEYDVFNNKYMIRTGIEAMCFLHLGEKLLFGASDGNVYEYDVGTDYDGTPIDAYWETPAMDLGAKYAKKSSTTLYAHASGTGKLKIQAEFGNRVKEKMVTLTEEMKLIKVRIPSTGRLVKLRFSNVEGSNFQIHAPQILIEPDED